MDELRFMVLGPVRVVGGSGEVPLGPPLQRTLLVALLADAPRSVPLPVLLERLWGDDPPHTAVKSIQKYVSHLRGALGRERIVSRGGYQLIVEPHEVDALVFEEAFRRVRTTASPTQRIESCAEALALWRGEPYADLVEPQFLGPIRHRLEEMRLLMIEERLGAHLETGDAERVVAETGELVEAHPFRERLWQLRMSALAVTGRQADALVEYRRLRDLLGDQLGIEPSAESSRLEERILLQEPGIGPGPETRGNLPAGVATVLAREDELERLAGLLGRSRLITVVGTGGVGKTTLALELARRRATDFADGAWLVELGPLTEGDRVPERTADVLGVHQAPDRPTGRAVAEFLAARSALVVFDNCEHLVETAAAFVASLLQAAPGLRVIATSRQPLGITGESVFPVEPLPVPPPETSAESALTFPAVRLLFERAEAAGVARSELERAAGSLADICRHLDGIPLAIELAAPRLRTFAAADLAERLRRAGLPPAARRDVPDRQQTLEAAIDWSYRLLTSEEQTLLVQLAVFRGGFTLDAAEKVCASAGVDIAVVLAGLADRSLAAVTLAEGGGVRYRLLRIIRQFAEGRRGGDPGPLGERHAAYYADLAGAASATRQTDPGRIRLLGADYENLRAALGYLLSGGDRVRGMELAAALGTYWSEVGALVEAQTWLDRALSAAPDAPADLRVRALLAAALVYQPFSSERTVVACTEAVALSRRIDDPSLRAVALCSLGRIHAVRAEWELADPLLAEARAIVERGDDRWALASCHEAIGVARRGLADHGIPDFRTAIELFRRAGALGDVAAALFSMTYRSLIPAGLFAEARGAAEESLSLSRSLGSRHTLVHACSGLAHLARLEGDLEHARALLVDCLERFRAFRDRRCTTRVLNALARIAIVEGDHPAAGSMLGEALRLSLELDGGRSSDAPDTIEALGLLAVEKADPAAGARWLAAGDAIRGPLRMVRPPPDDRAFVTARRAVEAALGTERYADLTRAGAGLTIEQVAAEAGAVAPRPAIAPA